MKQFLLQKLDPIEIMSEEEEDVVPTGVPVIPGARLSNHQEEYRHQTLIQHQSLLQRHLLSRNNTSLTPASRSIADDVSELNFSFYRVPPGNRTRDTQCAKH